MTELHGLSYSPWTEKARWALDHHGVSYRYVEHMPMLGEAALRWRARRLTGRVTVPLLVTEGGPLTDSFEIARFAERGGKSAPLFPDEHLADIVAWNDRSERALSAGRSLVVARTAASPAAQAEALPPFVPRALRPRLTFVAATGVAFFRWKYGLDAADEAARRAVIRGELTALRDALGGERYLLGDLTYADIAMAVTVQLVRPASDDRWPLGPATREAWRDPALEVDFGDLVEWRDRLYANHRIARL